MKIRQKIGIGLTTFVVMIGLGGGVIGQNSYAIAFYGIVFLANQKAFNKPPLSK